MILFIGRIKHIKFEISGENKKHLKSNGITNFKPSPIPDN